MLGLSLGNNGCLTESGYVRVSGVLVLCVVLPVVGCGSSKGGSAAKGCSTSTVVRTVGGPRAPSNLEPSAATVLGGKNTYQAMSLTRVTVGRSGSRLCVDFHANGPLVDPAFYELVMQKAGVGDAQVAVKLQVGFVAGEPKVALRFPGDEESPGGIYARARVQRSGPDTTVLIDRSEFPRWWPFERFRFEANGVAKGAPGAPFQQYVVTIPAQAAGFPH
jgi:hypothetical protein